MSAEQNKAVIRRFINEAMNGHDVDLMDELVAVDFIEHEDVGTDGPAGREDVKQLITMMNGAFPDFKAAIDDLIAEGDKVAVRMTWTGTQKAPFMGIPSSGKSFSIAVFDMFRIANGKIAEHWGMTDMGSMMQQLGAMPGPGET